MSQANEYTKAAKSTVFALLDACAPLSRDARLSRVRREAIHAAVYGHVRHILAALDAVESGGGAGSFGTPEERRAMFRVVR